MSNGGGCNPRKVEAEFSKARAEVLDRFSKLEFRIDLILADEIDPASERAKAFVSFVLLNTVILTFAAKVRLIRHLAAENERLPKEQLKEFGSDLETVMNLRNQFAHTYAVVSLNVEEPDEVGGYHPVEGGTVVIDTISGSGKFESKPYTEAVDLFRTAADRLEKKLRFWKKLDEFNESE